MKVLVTGSAGAVGSHMAERLVQDGHTVVGLDAYTDYYPVEEKQRNANDILSKGIETVTADLCTADLTSVISDDTEFIFHFAAQPGISAATPWSAYLANNIIATERLLERARALPRLRGLIYISTSSVYGSFATGSEETVPRPTSFYGVSKLAAEQLALSYARQNHLPVAVVRLFSVYGERERPDKLFRKLIAAIDVGQPFPLHQGSLQHRRSFTYVGDAVDGCTRLLDRFDSCVGEIFNIGTDETHTTEEGIQLVEDLMGKKATFETRPPRPGDQTETATNIDKARELLGYMPSMTLKEGLQREVAWYRARGN